MAFPRPGKLLTSAFFDALLARFEQQNIKQHGRGVLSGLAVTAGSGLEIDIAAGWILATSPVQLAAQSGVPVPASSARYVWIDAGGTVTLTATPDDIGGEAVCLGSVVTDGISVVDITHLGKMAVSGSPEPRFFQFGQHVAMPVEHSVLTSTKQLYPWSPNIQRIQCATEQKVLLPDPADMPYLGCFFEVFNDNDGGGEDVIVRDHIDSETVATLEPGIAGRFFLGFDHDAWKVRA